MSINFTKGFFLFLLMNFIYSCKCGDLTCPALDSKYEAWLSYKKGEVKTYTNSAGQEIKFSVTAYNVSEAQTLKCSADQYGGCHCGHCQSYNHSFAETTDTSRKTVDAQGKIVQLFNNLSISVTKLEERLDSVLLNYQIFDHFNLITIGPALKLKSGDTLLASYTVGNQIYSNVIVHQEDTTKPRYGGYFVWKSYYNKEYGVIAFDDLKTRTFFYRKP